MADSKRYMLTNTQPGPRGISTSGPDGTVMVAPQPAGTEGGGVIATLTDDEAAAAKKQGLGVKELGDTDRHGIAGTENLPAEGYVDVNHPDAADIHDDAPKAARKAAKTAKADKDEAEDKADTPIFQDKDEA